MGKKKPDPKRDVGKQKKDDDLLARHGMTKEQQFGAAMRAAAVPPSDFEGEYKGPGTYNTPGAQMLQRVLWEGRMRKATGIPKVKDDDMRNPGKSAMDLIAGGPKTTASPTVGSKSKDFLSGLTSEYGTKSLLKGMLKFRK